LSSRRRPLPRAFYARPAPEVARDLLGRVLVRRLGDLRLVARLVETEAYEERDPASHSYRGRTARTQVMFGPPGHLYVYFTYGMHFCINVVTGAEGEGSAVLLRAAEPLEGIPEMSRRRRTEDPRLLAAGPGRLTQALGIGREHGGLDLTRPGELFVAAGEPVAAEAVLVGPRVGIRVATEMPWRYSIKDSRFVSRRPVKKLSPKG
jgi:DNA-3-methyladenine glycosylase